MSEIDWFKTIRGLESKTPKTVNEILTLLESYGDKTWIFIDTETTGFRQGDDQLLEIAAIAIDPRKWFQTPEVLDTFSTKIRLNENIKKRFSDFNSKEYKRWEADNKKSRNPLKNPQNVLSLTSYGEKGVKFLAEQAALEKFQEFVEGFKEPLLVGQRIEHDLAFINGRKLKKMQKVEVLDTYPIFKSYLIPVLQKVASGNLGNDKIKNASNQVLKEIKNNRGFSASLEKLGPALKISTENLHSATADVVILMEIFKKAVKILEFADEKNLDIRPEYDQQMSYLRNLKRG